MVLKRMIITALMFGAFGLAKPAMAFDFVGLWLTPDQQGRWAFNRGEYQQAARLFEDPEWKAVSFYQSGDFANAAALFETFDTAWGQFNLANSYAKMENLEPAMAAYERTLEIDPEYPGAQFNLDYVTGLWETDNKEYEDAGGTDGQLKADRTIESERGNQAKSEVTAQQLQGEGLTEQQVQDLWMRRVQTTPGDFLKLKFSYQLNKPAPEEEAEE